MTPFANSCSACWNALFTSSSPIDLESVFRRRLAYSRVRHGDDPTEPYRKNPTSKSRISPAQAAPAVGFRISWALILAPLARPRRRSCLHIIGRSRTDGLPWTQGNDAHRHPFDNRGNRDAKVRIVAHLPLRELWRADGVLTTACHQSLTEGGVRRFFASGLVHVVVDVGAAPR
jgi:hypothetical protein